MNQQRSRLGVFGLTLGMLFSIIVAAVPASGVTVAASSFTLTNHTNRTIATVSDVTVTFSQDAGTISKDVVAFRVQTPSGSIYQSVFGACTNPTLTGSTCTNLTPTTDTLISNTGLFIGLDYFDPTRADSAATATFTISASRLTTPGNYTIDGFFADGDEGNTSANIDAAITAGTNVRTVTFTVAGITVPQSSYRFRADQPITAVVATPIGLTAPITYSIVESNADAVKALPAGLTLDVATRSIIGTPTTLTASAESFRIKAVDASLTVFSTAFTIEVFPGILPQTTRDHVFTAGSPITATAVYSNRFTTAPTYTTTPDLPNGLSIGTNGVITGTPTAAQNQTSYRVIATAAGLTDDVGITIRINATMTPASQSVTGVTGTAITPTTAFTPIGLTAPITYAANTALPAGLSINATTGVVSGIPTAAATAVAVVITATGAGGLTASAAITFNITAATIVPATQTYSYSVNTAITPTTAFTPTGFTGTVVYSVAPALPAGLVFNATTGVITGTPTLAQLATTYTITATGTTAGSVVGSGVATATVSITIGAAITPATRAVNITLNQAMTPTAAYTLNGFSGTISYVISPALPAGLVFNPVTGIITGTPIALVVSSVHTITATGSVVGTASTTITLSVLAPLAASTGVRATAGDRTANISWDVVVGATSYLVASEPAGAVCAITATQAVCSNLTNNTSYSFRVTAVNQAGPALLSTLSAAVTPKAPFVTKTGKITISYTPAGSVVPAASLVKLRALGTQFKRDKGINAVVSVKGFTTKGGTALEKRLATARATLAAQALRQAGLRGTYTTAGDGVTNRTGVKARKVVIKYTYQAPN